MNRRHFLAAISAGFSFATLGLRYAHAQDFKFIQALDAVQAHRPPILRPSARIAADDEPGSALVIGGRVVDAQRAPAAGVVVFAYHTDSGGFYDRPGIPPHSWRLRGWSRTDAAGRFEFRTIRPGVYPGRSIPAHVHFNVFAKDARYSVGELRFSDDSLVREDERRRAESAGEFAWVRPVTIKEDVQYVEFAIRLDPAQRF